MAVTHLHGIINVCLFNEDLVFLSQMTDAETVDYSYEILKDVKKTAKACSSLVELAIAVHQELMPLEQQRSQLDEEWSHSMLAAVSSGLCRS